MASPDPWPDLRHVRYVHLTARPPGSPRSEGPLLARVVQGGVIGACAAGSIALHAVGRATIGLVVGGLLGAAATGALGALQSKTLERSFALVPWGVLIDGPEELRAVRWSGVHTLDVRYRASRDGTVRTRVAVETVIGSFVGWASDAVDFGALAGNLADVAAASARPVAIDLDGDASAGDGEPFVERVLDAARRLLAHEGDRTLGLEPTSYREAHGPSSGDRRTARALRSLGVAFRGASDPWGLIAAIAGELRLASFAPELARMSNTPHPAVAAVARAALGRLRKPDDDGPALDADEGEALSWFVSPDELARLRAWRDA